MAAYCFCGCGRRVRFAKKKMSNRAAQAAWAVEVFRSVSPAIAGQAETARQRFAELADEGEKIRDLYAAIIHDLAPAPPVSQQTYIWEWEAKALPLAHEHAKFAAEMQQLEEAAPDFFAVGRGVDATFELIREHQEREAKPRGDEPPPPDR